MAVHRTNPSSATPANVVPVSTTNPAAPAMTIRHQSVLRNVRTCVLMDPVQQARINVLLRTDAFRSVQFFVMIASAANLHWPAHKRARRVPSRSRSGVRRVCVSLRRHFAPWFRIQILLVHPIVQWRAMMDHVPDLLCSVPTSYRVHCKYQ